MSNVRIVVLGVVFVTCAVASVVLDCGGRDGTGFGLIALVLAITLASK